jgi:hypothetical protein
VLLTCFNRPLGDHLAEQLAGVDQVAVHSFHALCRWQIGVSGGEFLSDPPQEWWDAGIADGLLAAVGKTGFGVDAVVVDEGQDFPLAWFLALEELLSDPDGPFYVFVDSHQAIYRVDWEPPFDGMEFELQTNCRNTLPIARAVAGIFGDESMSLGTLGPEPEYVEVESPEGVVRHVRGLLHRFLHQEGLRDDQVVVLSQHRTMVESLRDRELAGRPLVPLGGEGVVAETIHRFKGLEADVVIVVIESLGELQDRRLAYIGMSRARAQLVVVGPGAVVEELGS